MSATFKECSAFNQDISSWNMSLVTGMSETFNGCLAFNQNISSWDVSKVTGMYRMFNGCTAFKQNLSSWNLASITSASTITQLFNGVDLNSPNSATNTDNYDALLNGWAAKNLSSNVTINFGSSKFSAAGNVGREILKVNKGWNITDAGLKP